MPLLSLHRKDRRSRFKGEKELIVRIRNVEGLSSVNLQIQENVRRYIIWKGGKIDVRGPMFVKVRAILESGA